MAVTRGTGLADFASGLGNNVLVLDANNNRVGVNSASPSEALSVVGDANISGALTATAFVGDGSALTGISTLGNVTAGIVTANQFSGNISGVAATFTGNVTVGGTLTYEDVTNIDSVGLITARSGIEVVGFVTAQSGSAVTFSGGANITNAVETVNTGSYATGADPVSGLTTGILTLNTKLGTVFTHDVGSNQAVGVVSITNFPVLKNSFHTVSVIFTSSGYGNTTTANGIGTNVTLTPENVSGFSTESRVGAGDSVVISTTSGRDDIITFGIHYNGSGTGTPGNYKTYVSKNGDFRLIRG